MTPADAPRTDMCSLFCLIQKPIRGIRERQTTMKAEDIDALLDKVETIQKQQESERTALRQRAAVQAAELARLQTELKHVHSDLDEVREQARAEVEEAREQLQRYRQ